MTITEIATALDSAIQDVSNNKMALDEARKKYDGIIVAAEKEFSNVALQYDLSLEKAQALRGQLNTELNKLSPTTNQGRIRGAA